MESDAIRDALLSIGEPYAAGLFDAPAEEAQFREGILMLVREIRFGRGAPSSVPAGQLLPRGKPTE